MRKKLSRYGNSMAIIVDKPIMELLHMKEDTIVEIETDGRRLIITPVGVDVPAKKMRDPRLQQIVEEILDEYSEALTKLAK